MTSNGKPVAISLRNIRRRRAADALSGLQRDAARRGLDKLTMAEVGEEIQAVRYDRKSG